jgi:SAM-dependent methyltransferase
MNKEPDSRTQTLDGIEYRFSSGWIHRLEEEEHWRSYWQQLRFILPGMQGGDSVLEIGPGSGFLSNYLKSKGYEVTTLDIDDQKSPDIVANLVEYSFPTVYDHILAFEVFEHIPFEKFTESLVRLKRATRKNLFMSVPLNHKIWFYADLIIPYLKNISFCIRTKRRKILAGHHFWELDYKQYTLKYLTEKMKEAGFENVLHRRVKTLVFFQFRPGA